MGIAEYGRGSAGNSTTPVVNDHVGDLTDWRTRPLFAKRNDAPGFMRAWLRGSSPSTTFCQSVGTRNSSTKLSRRILAAAINISRYETAK